MTFLRWIFGARSCRLDGCGSQQVNPHDGRCAVCRLDLDQPIRTAESLSDDWQSLEQQEAAPGAIYFQTLSDEAAYERHCEAEEPILSRRAKVFAVGFGLAVAALIVGMMV